MSRASRPSVLLHNPRCSKSREALALLEERGVELAVRRYLDDPLDLEELRALRRKLGRPPGEWIRSRESAYAALGLGPDSSEEELLAAMAEHPLLLERPILIRGATARVGRPPEQLLELL